MTECYLSQSDIARHLGLARGTIASYSDKGMLPEPDVIVGLGSRPIRGWKQETIDKWQAARPRANRRRT